jgi:hypothetical protein
MVKQDHNNPRATTINVIWLIGRTIIAAFEALCCNHPFISVCYERHVSTSDWKPA